VLGLATVGEEQDMRSVGRNAEWLGADGALWMRRDEVEVGQRGRTDVQAVP
jgi:hypothetical protein